ncbi:hypothetical protein PCS_03575 [Desulfocurvibacter africanus PCS]|uniref:Uncharacterized protein n=1 Tax=Desulfocurvibacter africanus PCS TaxID=1262666 RepID=M5Q0K1_DESAF|nr:hypothetical protein [Desulfocurvibacter africanus]EMG35748.1 hypothetical protein PCS_03575 [Desulfocurvibacter africanus PCS]
MAKLHTGNEREDVERKAAGPGRTVGVYDAKGKKGRSKAMMIILVLALIIIALIVISRLV